jgi:hypothetical protein
MLGLLRRLISLSLKLGVLAAGIGAIIGYANLSDLESWKKDLQAQVMQVSGRRLHIDGPIDFKVTQCRRRSSPEGCAWKTPSGAVRAIC